MAKATDPVCGMEVNTETAAAKVRYDSKDYHFCSENCATQFRAEPDRFAGAGPERHEPPFTKEGGITAPKFGAAGSGGAEYEPLPERHDRS